MACGAGDEIWFNPGDNRYYFGNAQVGVIDAETNQLLGFLPGAGGHTLAVDSNNNIFVPVTSANPAVGRVRVVAEGDLPATWDDQNRQLGCESCQASP